MKISEITPLFIFDLANNHMGNVDHGLRVIRAVHEACKPFAWRFAFKFQYRQLDTFIHPSYSNSAQFKYVKRFQETCLSPEQFLRMKEEMDKLGFISMCTPFDEASVDLIEKHGIEILKVASCSFTDWPLLERIVASNKPIIASTAGASTEDMDKVVSFFSHRNKDFALMHCVADYPTPVDRLELNQIDFLRTRYDGVRVGFSTHESPANTEAVKVAVAKGAQLFERHVGVEAEGIKLNAYSANPEQVTRWLEAAREAFAICGIAGARYHPGEGELASLSGLRRGVFARKKLPVGHKIETADVFFAIPSQPGQVTANDFAKYTEFRVTEEIQQEGPLLFSKTSRADNREKIYAIVQAVKKLLQESRLAIPTQVDMEISHHYGVDRFYEYGITMLQVVNRAYCKKLLLMLPNQVHPEQYHEVKEETFNILYGDVEVTLNGERRMCHPGDVVTVEPGVRHIMSTKTGVIIEEISTTHRKQDSFYTDPAVMANRNRKTLLTYWMR